MRTTYIANSSEAANLHSGKQTAIVTLVKPQPTLPHNIKNADVKSITADMYDNSRVCFNIEYARKDGASVVNGLFSPVPISLPYAPGQTIAVRESWAETCDEYGVPIVAFKSNNNAFYIGPKFEILGECTAAWDIGNYPACGKWRSPVTMPREAVRTHLLVKDVLCVRVQDMTSEQAQAIWPGMNNIERMQDLHRKLGSDAWADNVFVFITKVEKI